MTEHGPHAGLADTHCHLDLFADPAGLARRIEQAKVYTIAVTNAPSVFDALSMLVGESRFVRVALGLHPQLAASREHELDLFRRLQFRTRYIGEVGLDYQTGSQADRVTQRRVLSAVLDACSASKDKILTVHSRRAADDVISAFDRGFPGTFILHWFSGSIRALRKGVDAGAYFSVNLAMLRSQRARALLSELPRERVLTESDGPFVTATEVWPREPATPLDMTMVIAELAKLWSISLKEATAQTFANFRRLLRVSTPGDAR